jgi:predicted ArsR family transcriptional regulator
MVSGNNNNTTLLNKHMPVTRRRILSLLKEHGDLTADELADLLNISSVAVRRHLTKLESDQLVAYNEVQRGMGRPSFLYRLGPAADTFFPRRYEDLALNVLETIRDLYGPEAIDAIFRIRSEHLLETYRPQITGPTLPNRLEQLTQLREADGYMSTWKPETDGSFTLREANCPIIHVAADCDAACNQDMLLLEALLEATITRHGHLAGGDDACVYQVRPKN